MTRAECIFYLILAAGINYPIWKEKGYILNRVLTLVVNSGETSQVIKILSTPHSYVLDEFAREDQIREALEYTHSAYVIIPYSDSERARRVRQLLCASIRTGKMNAMPILVSEKPFIEDVEYESFFVFAEDGLSDINMDWKNVIPSFGKLPVMYDKMQKYCVKAESQIEKFWTACACCMFSTAEFPELLKMAHQIAEFDENCRETHDLSEAFVEAIYDWQSEQMFCNIYELPYLEEDAVQKMKEKSAVFYDTEYVFFPEKLFKAAVVPLMNYVPMGILKQHLCDDGILIVDRAGGYTVKKTFYDEENKRQNMRVMRFKRDRINVLGEIDFVMACEVRKEKRDVQ